MARTRNDTHVRLRYFESKREQEVLYLLLARPDVVDVWDQPPPIRYQDADGTWHPHFFDYLCRHTNGSQTAIAFKPAAIVEQRGFRETLQLIRAATPLSFAKDVVLITERCYRPSAARNAQKLHEFRRTPDAEADEAIAALIPQISSPITMGELAGRSGLGGRAFRAAFKAIYAGKLATLDAGDILPTTLIKAGAAL